MSESFWKRAWFVVAACAAFAAVGCGEEDDEEPGSCAEMVDKEVEICGLSADQRQIKYEARCNICSDDGELRWRACVAAAESCGAIDACQCSN